jgi:hypothetical protein
VNKSGQVSTSKTGHRWLAIIGIENLPEEEQRISFKTIPEGPDRFGRNSSFRLAGIFAQSFPDL